MSNKFYKIGIIGHGFVGKAVTAAFGSGLADRVKFCVYDPKYAGNKQPGFYDKIEHVVDECDIVFICVPTPTNFNEETQDLSILEQVVEKASAAVGKDTIFVIKSTVLPGTTRRFEKRYPHVKFVYNPEFLREKTFIKDFIQQDNVVIGANQIYVAAEIQNLYTDAGIGNSFSIMPPEEAELVKYAVNCFLATKVAFFNEIDQLCGVTGIDYDMVRATVARDARIGGSHTEVPGPDGKKGFGGKCFPKDIIALVGHIRRYALLAPVLAGVWQKNSEVREEADWLNIEGASSEN